MSSVQTVRCLGPAAGPRTPTTSLGKGPDTSLGVGRPLTKNGTKISGVGPGGRRNRGGGVLIDRVSLVLVGSFWVPQRSEGCGRRGEGVVAMEVDVVVPERR
jgi:hypothetical protein